MKAKLIKTDTDNFILQTNEGIISGTLEPTKFEYKLSLKNCQAVENGYDLDELARKRFLPEYETNSMFSIFEIDCKREGFVEGAKAILEILGDKKFSEGDMRKMYDMSCGKIGLSLACDPSEDEERFKSFLGTVLQTEWDVEVLREQDFSNRSCNTCCYGTEGKCELKKKNCVSKTGNENHVDWWASRLDNEEDSEIYKPLFDKEGHLILKRI